MESDLGFRTDGRITERLVGVGDHVSSGQVLAKLDPQEQQAAVDAAESDVRAAEAKFSNETSNLARQKRLLAAKVNPQSEYDRAEESFRTAQSSLEAAKAQLGTARDALAQTELRAGNAGTITARNAEIGQVVSAGQRVFVLAHDGPRDAVFNVNESVFGQQPIDRNIPIQIKLVTDPSIHTTGKVREITPTLSGAGGTLAIKVGLDESPPAMTLGAAVFGEGPQPLDSQEAITLPPGSLASAAGQPSVWIVDPATSAVSARPITIARYETDRVTCRGGASTGRPRRHAQRAEDEPKPDGRHRGGAPAMKTSWILLLAAVAGLTACHRRAAAPAPPIRPVLSIIVAPEAAGGAAFAGTVDARYESILGFRVLGRMIARDVNVGDNVKQGARLAALDPTPFQLALRNAEADLARADAHLQEAKSNAARQRQLFQRGVNAKAEFEAAQHEFESAEASQEAAQANVRIAQEKLGYTELRAEFDGVVTATKAEVGQVVQPGQEVVHVVRPEEREAVVDVPDNIAANLRPGIGFIVTSEAEPATRVKGLVREIAPQADLATRTRRVKITLVDPPLSFRLGTIVKAVAGMDAGAEIELPSSALLERDGKTFVWVVDAATEQSVDAGSKDWRTRRRFVPGRGRTRARHSRRHGRRAQPLARPSQ